MATEVSYPITLCTGYTITYLDLELFYFSISTSTPKLYYLNPNMPKDEGSNDQPKTSQNTGELQEELNWHSQEWLMVECMMATPKIAACSEVLHLTVIISNKNPNLAPPKFHTPVIKPTTASHSQILIPPP